MSALLLLFLAACGEPTPPPPPAPTATTPAPAPTAAAPAQGPWNLASVAQLEPVLPTREGRTPKPIPPDPAYAAADALLAEIVNRYGGDPENPWAVAHGLLAQGPDFKLTNGEPGVEYLFATYAEELPAGGGAFVRFPTQKGKKRIEPHSALMLKNFAEIGVRPDRKVTVNGRPHTVADLYRGVLLSSWLDPARNHASFDSPNDVPWALQALATWAPEGPLRWTSTDGTEMDLDNLATFTVTVLVQETAFLQQAAAAGADFEKKGQGIFSYTCGGAHILQGASYAVARGRSTAKAKEAVLAQIPLWFYRLPKELTLYDQAMKQAPEHEVRLLVQRLKFAGHFLESMEKMAALGLFTPTDEQQKMLIGAAQQIALTTQALQAAGVFQNMETLRTQDEQLYLDVVGDAAHALRGLRLATGAGTLAW